MCVLGPSAFMSDRAQNIVFERRGKVNGRLTKPYKGLSVPHNVKQLVEGKGLCIF
jgi:hypothetical protein